MEPFNFVIDMVSDNDFFNTVIDINTNQNQDFLYFTILFYL